MANYPPIVQVDDSGNVLGPVSYESAHPKDETTHGIRHLSSNVFIFEDISLRNILLTERSAKISRKGRLNVCIGGHAIWLEQLNRAQTPLEAALSELSEEVFYNASLPEELRKTLHPITTFPKDLRPNDPEYVHLFQAVYRGPFSLNPDEVSSADFRGVESVVKDVQEHPELYVKSASLYLERLLVCR